MVSLGSNGEIASQGTVPDALEHDSELQLELSQSKKESSKETQDIDASDNDVAAKGKKSQGKLVLEEETAEGHISWESSA